VWCCWSRILRELHKGFEHPVLPKTGAPAKHRETRDCSAFHNGDFVRAALIFVVLRVI
jgi:hypothetical protein